MPPFFLAEICELDQSCDLVLENAQIGSPGAGVKIPPFIGILSHAKAILGFCKIFMPTHDLILHASVTCSLYRPYSRHTMLEAHLGLGGFPPKPTPSMDDDRDPNCFSLELIRYTVAIDNNLSVCKFREFRYNTTTLGE
jgi:hypothetical protein